MNNIKQITEKVDAQKWIEENKLPEVGTFSEKKLLQKFYKQLSDEQLAEWCELEGLEYKPCPEQPPIHRMRMCMAILYKHFPKAPPATKKSKSKYAEYTLESLIELAIEKDVPVEPTENEKIMRMRTIMALRAANVIG